MPIEIPAGESYTFDVLLWALAAGESELEFNLFIEANSALYIQPVAAKVRVLPAAEQKSDIDDNSESNSDPVLEESTEMSADTN